MNQYSISGRLLERGKQQHLVLCVPAAAPEQDGEICYGEEGNPQLWLTECSVTFLSQKHYSLVLALSWCQHEAWAKQAWSLQTNLALRALATCPSSGYRRCLERLRCHPLCVRAETRPAPGGTTLEWDKYHGVSDPILLDGQTGKNGWELMLLMQICWLFFSSSTLQMLISDIHSLWWSGLCGICFLWMSLSHPLPAIWLQCCIILLQ